MDTLLSFGKRAERRLDRKHILNKQLHCDFKAIDISDLVSKQFSKDNGQMKFLITKDYCTVEKLNDLLQNICRFLRKRMVATSHKT